MGDVMFDKWGRWGIKEREGVGMERGVGRYL